MKIEIIYSYNMKNKIILFDEKNLKLVLRNISYIYYKIYYDSS